MKLTRRGTLSLLSGVFAGSACFSASAADDPVSVPIGISGGRVVMNVTLNEGRNYRFAVDTGGAASLIRESVAREAGLSASGFARVGAFGSDDPRQVYQADSVIFGGMIRQNGARFVAVSGDGLGDGIAGSLASGLLTTLPGELDFDACEWRVWQHGRPVLDGFTALNAEFSVPPSEAWSPFLLADARVNGAGYRFLLDTGSPSFVRLNHRTARQLGLWSDDRPFAPLGGGRRVVRISSLEFGGSTFERPLALLLPGNLEADVSDGLIGLPTLQRFNLFCDRRRNAILVRRNGTGAPPEHYPLSGLEIGKDGRTVLVVGTGSPAQAAGVRTGDAVLSDGSGGFRGGMNGKEGDRITLRVGRGGGEREVSFVLRGWL